MADVQGFRVKEESFFDVTADAGVMHQNLVAITDALAGNIENYDSAMFEEER